MSADGFGGGRDKAAKLEIMRDSRLGTYGAMILLVSFVAKLSAMVALPAGVVLPALITAHATGAAALSADHGDEPALCARGRSRRHAGRPAPATAMIAAVLALFIAFLCCRWRRHWGRPSPRPPARARSGCSHGARSAARTGDVLGGAEQSGETAILLLLAARFA